jgi:hypothetical protein
MTAVIRTCALESLADYLTCQVPELVDRVCVGVPPSGHEQTYPSMTINAVKWRTKIGEVEILAGAPPGILVQRVGHHEGLVQVRILAANDVERDELADKVIQAFLGFVDEQGWEHPSTILTRLTECGYIPWTACFDLDTDEAINLDAFDRKYEALLEVDATIPALTCRGNVPTVDQLLLGVTQYFTTAYTSATMAAPAVEVVVINADGTIVPYTP